MNFPTILYKCPGDHQRAGGTFSYMGINNEAEYLQAIKDGWFATLVEAIEGFDKPKAEEQEKKPEIKEPESNDAPTRDELEAKAKELGIKFDGRNSDANLAKKIQGKLDVMD